MFKFLSYREITTDDAELLLDWRTAPEIARYMLTQVAHDLGRQKQWIADCNNRADYAHRIIRIQDKDVGYASIKVTDSTSSIGELGVYIGDRTVPRELSAYNFVGTLNHAFFTMGLHKIVNHIIADNDRTLKLQAFNGYRHVGVLAKHILKDGVRHDLHIFEQAAEDWAEFRRKWRDKRDWNGVEVGD